MGNFADISSLEGIFWGIVIFFALRYVFTWYWKINRIVELLEKIDKNTENKSGVGEV